MNQLQAKIKLSFVQGLKEVVLEEIKQHKDFRILHSGVDSVYLDYAEDFSEIKSLRSVSRAYMVVQDAELTPLYVFKHKSILDGFIEKFITENGKKFKTFKISCAGADSKEVRATTEYIAEKYKLVTAEEADLKIHIIKLKDTWELGVQMTLRPLSLRDYKAENMSGAMDPSIAFSLNSLCDLESVESYLNVFSGSGTLLIEAGQCYPNTKKLVGFDNDKKHISLSIQNIKKAGLIKRVEVFEKDIFDKPDLGKFDVVTSDLPFGMVVSKGEDLEKLYTTFLEYCVCTLNQGGKLAVYTSEHEVFEKAISKSEFKISRTLDLKFLTSVDAYLKPKIFICVFK